MKVANILAEEGEEADESHDLHVQWTAPIIFGRELSAANSERFLITPHPQYYQAHSLY